MAIQLTDVQKKAVGGWTRQGLGLGDIQRRLKEDFGISMAFIDVRFLVLDLSLKIQDKAVGESADLKIGKAAQTQPKQDGLFSGAAPAGAGEPGPEGGVSVEIDRIKKPGAMISGSVMFSDGVKASWALDQYGRVAIDAGQPGYRPTEEDLMAFQREVASKLQAQGY